MNNSQLFSRRNGAAVDFRPDPDPASPFSQLRRLSTYLQASLPPKDELSGCRDALDYLREYTYRKIFTNTPHEQFVATDTATPEVIDWLIAVHEIENSNFRNRKTTN